MLALSVVAAILMLGWFSPATAERYEHPEGTVYEINYDALEGPPGTVIFITGQCLWRGQPAERVRVRFKAPNATDEIEAANLLVGRDGGFQGQIQVPASTPYGAYELTASCYKEDFGVGPLFVTPFEVTDPTTTTRPPATAAPPTTEPTTTAPPSTKLEPTTVQSSQAPQTTTRSTIDTDREGALEQQEPDPARSSPLPLATIALAALTAVGGTAIWKHNAQRSRSRSSSRDS